MRRQIDVDAGCPACDCEKVGVSDREIVADEILVIGKVPIQMCEPRGKTTPEYHFGSLGDPL